MARINNNLPKSPLNAANLKKSTRIFRFMSGKDRWLFFIGTVFLALTAGAALLFPKLLGDLVNSASLKFTKGDQITTDKLEKTAIYFVYLFIAQAVFSFLRIALYVRVTENMTFGMRKSLYSSVIFQNMEFFSKNRVGELFSRFSADISQIQDTFTSGIATFLRQLLIIFGGVIYLFFSSTTLALWMLATIPVVVIISLFFGKYIRKISRQVQDFTANNNVIVEETLSGVQNVKAFSNEEFEVNRYADSAEVLRKESIYRGLLRGSFSSFIIICLFGSFVFLIFKGLTMVRADEIPIGELITFMMLTGFVGGSIAGIAEQFVQIQKTIGAVERVLDIIDSPGENILPSKSVSKITGNISIKHLSFSYPSRPGFEVLKDISLELEEGKTLAVVGPSGVGKSTLIALLYRFYEPVQGQIMIGEKDTSEIDLFQLRNSMALVPQEIILFGGTIYDNILYGKPEATEAEIIAAAQKANAHQFIEQFPEKYQTIVGDRGIRLSGGQKQRVAIARAILKDPNFLFLDEATSSLDSESERLVQDALEKLMENRTSVIIAHRLSTIRNADKIAVLKNGKVAEYGDHDALMKLHEGLYRRMVEQQQEPEEFFMDKPHEN